MDVITETTPENVETPLEPEVSQEQPELDADESQEESVEDELEEVEYLGEKYKVNKALAEVISKAEHANRDYTQKTQAIAETRKAVELQREEIELERDFSREVEQERSQLANVESQLSVYQRTDWAAWTAANPQEAQSAFMHYQQMKDARENLHSRINERSEEYQAKVTSNRRDQLAKAETELQRPDPSYGWQGKFDASAKEELAKFARDELQWTPERVAGLRTAQQVKDLHLMKVGFEAIKAKQKAATQPRPQAAPVPQVSSGKGKASSDPEKMSDAQWMKWRQSQMQKKAS